MVELQIIIILPDLAIPTKTTRVYKYTNTFKTDASRKKAIPGGVGVSNLAKRAYALRSKVGCCDKK